MKSAHIWPLLGFLVVPAVGFAQPVVINEIMYHPVPAIPEDDRLEWLELFNAGTNAVDLKGWRLSKGINFNFTNQTVMPPGGYLIVAADPARFAAVYPGLDSLTYGPWRGVLSNNGDDLELDDATGQTIAAVSYASEGDWAIRQRGPLVQGHQGWIWFTEADGLGKSLELINPAMPINSGQNWAASVPLGGTPGAANSVANGNIAPLILDVAHFPPVPGPADTVAVTARILDEAANGFSVSLFYRVDTSPQAGAFNQLAMVDDGAHGDGVAGDGVFGAILPARPEGTVVEFYVQATDASNNTRTWPAPTQPTGTQTANLFYQVNSSTFTGGQPLFHLIMAEADRAELASIPCAASDSDAEMNGTFLSIDGVKTEIRYRCGFRNRGHGSRCPGDGTPNYRVDVPNDHPLNGRRHINLNSQFTHVQVFGSTLFQRSGVPMANSRAVQVRVNGVNRANAGLRQFGSYAQDEELGSEFLAEHFPTDTAGNIYRGIRVDPNVAYANFNYYGPLKSDCIVPPACYTNLYFKQNNISEDDFSDIIQVCYVLSTNTSDALFPSEVHRVIDVTNWMLYFAVNTLVDNRETALSNGEGDDYAAYRSGADGRMRLMGYDTDTIVGQGDSPGSITAGLFGMTNAPGQGIDRTNTAITRLMTWPEFTPLYYATLKHLVETTFATDTFNGLIDRTLGSWVPNGTINAMKSWQAQRNAFVLSQLPTALSVTSPTNVASGYLSAGGPTVDLAGRAHIIDTRAVRVNGAPAAWDYMRGAWSIAGVPLQPGINRLLIQAFNAAGQEFERLSIDVRYDDGSVANVGGTLSADATWTAAGGPYQVTSTLVVPAGVRLTIEPGASVYVTAGANITINGTLAAAGTETQHIRFTRVPGANNWGSLDFINATNESRLAYADIEFSAGTSIGGHSSEVHVNNSKVFFDHLTFTNQPAQEYISFDGSSFIVQNSLFPTYPQANSGPEMLHGVNGIPAGGYGIFRDNYFGHTYGFNDTIDFTGGNRPGAILQVIHNVFDGAGDDHLDLDSTDAWIEGNIFMHAHRDPNRSDDPRDTSSAISGGVDFATQYSEWTIVNNLFFDVDHAILNKQGGRLIFANNTLVHVAKENGAGLPDDIAAFDFTDDGLALPDPSVGAGAFVSGNILWDCARLMANYNPSNHTVIFDNNLLPVAWDGPGTNNLVADPRLNLALITNVAKADWRTVLAAFQPRSGSPALGSAPGGFDRGGLNPPGIRVSGEPLGVTTSKEAVLTVEPGGTFLWGSVVPPYEWGYTRYKWKLDDGPWSAPVSTTTTPTIHLTGLSVGPHQVSVVGQNDAGFYQDDPLVYPPTAGIPAHASVSRTWVVTNDFARVQINEVLARNRTAVPQGDGYPDLVELYNPGSLAADLSGMGLTDDPSRKFRFQFAPGTTLGPGQYLVLAADNETSPGLHLGFGLSQSGDSLALFSAGGDLVDAIEFGLQLADLSIGRLASGAWGLTIPTFGAANVAQPVGEPGTLKINEWLADGAAQFTTDFIELYSPDPLPIPVGGLYLTDAPYGAPHRSRLPDLSFIQGFGVFLADGKPEAGAEHLSFKLSPLQGQIALFAADSSLIDCVIYGPQSTDVSQGRQPNGGDGFAFFPTVTPGAPNPTMTVSVTVTTTVVDLFGVTNKQWRYEASGQDLGTSWRGSGFNDASWPSGLGMFGFETTPGIYPYPFQTTIPAPNQPGGQITVYYRTHFSWTNGPGFSLISTNYVDDGAIFYINGTEVGRLRLTGTVNAGTLAANASEPALDVLTLAGGALVAGDNVLAVEVHQSSTTSSDDVFGMALSAVKSETNIVVQGIVLNEVLARNLSVPVPGDTNLVDWAELYNPSGAPIDLSNKSLSDDLSAPRRWVFPAGTSLAAGAYLVVQCDPARPASSNAAPVLNTGFGLSADRGDALYLFDSPARGSGLLDSVVFGIQAADFSIARVPDGNGAWTLALPTPAGRNVPASIGSIFTLRVNEWMANPSSGEDFLELFNPAAQPVSLAGLFLTDDLNIRNRSRIRPLSFIGTGLEGFALFVADGTPSNGANHVDFKLDKDGESIGLFTATGTLIDAINFAAQEKGVSEGRFPDGSSNIVRFHGTDTPGESNLLPLEGVAINEVLAATGPSLEKAIELRNPTATAVDLSHWYLSDNKKLPKKFRIPNGTILAADGFAVFYEQDFNPFPGANRSLTLDPVHGGELFLYTGDASGNLSGFRAGVKFGAADSAVSAGRYETSVGADFTLLSARTFGADNPASVEEFRTGKGLPNAHPAVGPVVISEIMYHPPDIISATSTNDDDQDEFIELLNFTAAPVRLFDQPNPTNTWHLRDAVDFDFPPGISLEPNGRLLVVGFDPATNAAALAAFRAHYGLGDTVPIFGPWKGKLANDDENIELYRPGTPQPPDAPDAGFVPAILVDRVHYADSNPWPALADGVGSGVGMSLQRVTASEYGNDPVNWIAGIPSPGAPNGPAPLAPPSISSLSPAQAVSLGGSATMTVAATGGGILTYQWRFNGALIPGATGPAFTISNFQSTNAGAYSVLVANEAGADSASTRLTVRSAPFIVRQPQNQIVVAGSPAVFSVVAGGSQPLTYAWLKNGVPIPDAVEAALVIPDSQIADVTSYRVIITNAFGSITSSVAVLELNSPPVILSQPRSTNVFIGNSVAFSVTAAGSPPFHYQWRFNGAAISGATNGLFTLLNVQLTNAGNYSVVVANAVGSTLSDPATLGVFVAPIVRVTATDPFAAEGPGNPGQFTVTRTGPTDAPLAVNFAIGGTATSGADYNGLFGPLLIPAGTNAASLTVVVVDDAVREGNETVILTLTQGPGYVIGTPASATVTIFDNDNSPPTVSITSPFNGFSTSLPAIITLTALASDSDGSVARVEYFDNATNRIGQSVAPPYTVVWTNAASGIHLLTAVATDNLGSTGNSAPILISVNTPPEVALVNPQNGVIVPVGTNITLVANASDSDGVVVQVDFFQGSTLLGSDNTPPFSFVWTNVAAGEYTLTAQATDERGASTMSRPIVVTVGAAPPRFGDNFAGRGLLTGFTNTILGNSSNFTREAGEPRHDNRNGTHSGWMTWTAPSTGLCVMDTFGSSFDTVLAVYTNNTLPTLVRVISNDDANQDTSESQLAFNAVAGTTYQIAIDGFSSNAYGNFVFHCGLPNPFPIFLVQPQSQTTTQGLNVTFSAVTGGPGPQQYQWRFNNANIANETNTVLVRTNVTGANGGNYVLVATNSSGGTTSAVAVLTVRTVATFAAQPADVTVQPGGNVTLFVRVTGFGPFTYQWRFNGVPIADATATNLVLREVLGRNAGAYSVVVSNPIGTNTSRNAILSVDDGLFILLSSPVFSLTNVWRYRVDGEDLGSDWRAPGYDDSSWSNGIALFGLETTPQVYSEPFRTVFPIETTNGIPITNFYFRTGFVLDNPGALSGLLATAYVDDGAVWYINGREAARLRINNAIPVDGVPHTTIATNLNTEGVASAIVLPVTNAVAGLNVLCVELHQGTIPSSDAVFGMSLDALTTVTNFPSLLISDLQDGSVHLTLNGIPGRDYAIDISPDLLHWVALTSFTNFNSTSDSFTMPFQRSENRFFRARVGE